MLNFLPKLSPGDLATRLLIQKISMLQIFRFLSLCLVSLYFLLKIWLAQKIICTEDQVSKLIWILGFSCRFPVIAKCLEISLPIIKVGNTHHVLNNLENFIYHNSALKCAFALKCTANLKNIYRPTLSSKLC